MKLTLSLLLLLVSVQLFAQKATSSQMIVDSIYSKELKEYRKYCLYLPKDFDSKRKYPVVHTTDGQIIVDGNYKTSLDSLIDISKNPFLLIGAYSNDKITGKNSGLRQEEYVYDPNNTNPSSTERFTQHLTFFNEELPALLSKKHKLKYTDDQHSFYGCSNGGGFGIYLFLNNKASYSNYICLSPVGGYDKIFKPVSQNSLITIGYGQQEPQPFLDSFNRLTKEFTRLAIIYRHIPFPGGHDRSQWKRLFIAEMTRIYEAQ